MSKSTIPFASGGHRAADPAENASQMAIESVNAVLTNDAMVQMLADMVREVTRRVEMRAWAIRHGAEADSDRLVALERRLDVILLQRKPEGGRLGQLRMAVRSCWRTRRPSLPQVLGMAVRAAQWWYSGRNRKDHRRAGKVHLLRVFAKRVLSVVRTGPVR